MVNPHLSQSLVIPTSMNDPNITLLTSYVPSYPNHIHYYIRRFPKIGVSQNHPCFGESASINVYYLRIYLGIPHLWKPPSQPVYIPDGDGRFQARPVVDVLILLGTLSHLVDALLQMFPFLLLVLQRSFSPRKKGDIMGMSTEYHGEI